MGARAHFPPGRQRPGRRQGGRAWGLGWAPVRRGPRLPRKVWARATMWMACAPDRKEERVWGMKVTRSLLDVLGFGCFLAKRSPQVGGWTQESGPERTRRSQAHRWQRGPGTG